MNCKAILIWFSFPSLMLFFAGCDKNNNNEPGTLPTAAFIITPVVGKANTYALRSSSQDAFGFQWDKGNGKYVKGSAVDTAYFALKGNYIITLRAFGRGGYASASQPVIVESDDIQNNPAFQALVAHAWKLNGEPGANPIVVGTEDNPSQYFAGGALDNCQMDDRYIFSSELKLTYNANVQGRGCD